jgi:hypothetical protein
MNDTLKKLIIVAVVLAIIGGGIGFYMKNKKVGGLESVKPDFTLTATELFSAFSTNEPIAIAMYNGKVVQVEGEIMDITQNIQKREGDYSVNKDGENLDVKSKIDTLISLLLVADESGMGTVKCGLDKSYAKVAQQLKIEQRLKLKCICSGVTKVEDFGITLMDIELSRCVIVK